MLYYFKKGKNATEMQKTICTVYQEGAVTEWMYQKWFVNFMLQISRWIILHGQTDNLKVDSDQIETLIENNQRYTTLFILVPFVHTCACVCGVE